MQWMIEVDRLVKRFGLLTAVDDVSFNVAQGEVLGFLGPNGAGKSTTMKMITGFLTPTSGTVRVAGHNVIEDPIAAKSQIGYLPEGAPAYPDMTPRTFLEFIAEIRGLKGAERKQRIDYVVEHVHLEGVLEQPIDTLSKGFKRRVGLAQSILHDPPVLVLDEPTDGLDPNQKHEVRSLITRMGKDKAIIISTHILEEVDALCSRAMIIANGKLLADGTPQDLERRSPLYNAVLLTTQADGAAEALARLDVVSHVERLGGDNYRIYPKGNGSIVAQVADEAGRQGWPVTRLSVETPRLDEVFRQVTTGDAGTAKAVREVA